MSGEATNDLSLLETGLDVLNHENNDRFREVIKIWRSIYGPNSSAFHELFDHVHKTLKEFWEYEIEKQSERQESIMKSIEQSGKEAIDLEKALGLPSKVNELSNDKPLVELEEQLWELLNSYKELKEKRMAEYDTLQKKEQELCTVLGDNPEFIIFSDAHKPSGIRSPLMKVPSTEYMVKCEERIQKLENLKSQLIYEFEASKEELRNLLDDCEIIPFNKMEKFVCARDDDESYYFPVSKENLEKLLILTKQYRERKNQMICEADDLRKEIATLSSKMLKDTNELDVFLTEHNGFTQPTLNELKKHLKALKEERKLKLKDLIFSHRSLLDEWWTKCCYSDKQRAEFHPYQADFYSEDVLDFHELELENLQHFYNNNKRIFQLADKHRELWDRLLHLEQQANDKNRLFSNRGGQLLQEEKERKLIQKKVPSIREELTKLLVQYKAASGKDFLYFGEPLVEILRQMEMERDMAKENLKLMRKTANTENILLESRMGTQAVAGSKRKVIVPLVQTHSPTKVMRMGGTLSAATSTSSLASSTKSTGSHGYGQRVIREADRCATVRRTPHANGMNYLTPRTPGRTPRAAKTPVHSTPACSPDNGSPSYESFQNSKDLLSSTKDLTQRVLRPRNINNITVTKTPKSTPKTPIKTPSKIPFRIATGGKIPSVLPPISPRKPAKLTTPRSKLPLIF